MAKKYTDTMQRRPWVNDPSAGPWDWKVNDPEGFDVVRRNTVEQRVGYLNGDTPIYPIDRDSEGYPEPLNGVRGFAAQTKGGLPSVMYHNSKPSAFGYNPSWSYEAKQESPLIPKEQPMTKKYADAMQRRPSVGSSFMPEDFSDLMVNVPADRLRKVAESQLNPADFQVVGQGGIAGNVRPAGSDAIRDMLYGSQGATSVSPTQPNAPQDRHPGMPPSVANFDGRKIAADGAAARVAERDAQRKSVAGKGKAMPAPGSGPVYRAEGSDANGAIKSGDPFFDVNTDFSALAERRLLKDRNDQSFTQLNRGHMNNIAAKREADTLERQSRLQKQGFSPDEVTRIMYPERFQDEVDAAKAQVASRGRPALQSESQNDLVNGRLSVDSRTDAIMRKARLNGQNIPYAMARSMASSEFPTQSDATAGMPSLPGLDPMRIAKDFSAGQGMAAGQYGVGMGRNQNEAGRDQMVYDLGKSGQDNQRRANDQDYISQILREAIAGSLGRGRLDNETKVTDATIGNPGNKDREAALAWLNSPAAKDMQFGSAEQRQFYNDMMNRATGAAPQSQQPAAPGAAPTPPAAQPPSLPSQEQFLANNPAALQKHLAQFADPQQRQMEMLRIHAKAGTPNADAGRVMMDRFKQDDPNLAWGPDHWAQSYGGGQSIFQALFGLKPIAERGADYAAQQYGIPREWALPYMQQYYDNM